MNDLDRAETALRHAEVIRRKRMLHRIYQVWYSTLATHIPTGPGRTLELGSGGGFMREVVPGLICSDVLQVPAVDIVLDAVALPFATASLRAILMTDVFHHVSRPRSLLAEAARCVRPGGVVAMIEPWVSPWSRFVFGRFHHEPFRPDAETWEFVSTGPLSGANGALPWIVFERDKTRFAREFPQWRVHAVEPMMPVVYLLSGGVTHRAFVPAWSFAVWSGIERAIGQWIDQCAMFALIVLERTESRGE